LQPDANPLGRDPRQDLSPTFHDRAVLDYVGKNQQQLAPLLAA
jgi:hypothetical protein